MPALVLQEARGVPGIVGGRHPSWRLRLTAGPITVRWVRACGKLPGRSPVGPISSAYRPRWYALCASSRTRGARGRVGRRGRVLRPTRRCTSGRCPRLRLRPRGEASGSQRWTSESDTGWMTCCARSLATTRPRNFSPTWAWTSTVCANGSRETHLHPLRTRVGGLIRSSFAEMLSVSALVALLHRRPSSHQHRISAPGRIGQSWPSPPSACSTRQDAAASKRRSGSKQKSSTISGRLVDRTTRDSAGADCRILAIRKYARCRGLPTDLEPSRATGRRAKQLRGRRDRCRRDTAAAMAEPLPLLSRGRRSRCLLDSS